jgi:predicted amino acid racemase
MAELLIKPKKIISNIKKINDLLEKHDIKWTLICKVLSGHKPTLEQIMSSPEIDRVGSVGDSRLSNLEAIKKINPNITTMYIKPPPIPYAKSVVSVADISLNTSEDTIKALNKEAKKQDKVHQVIIMIELGELREGIMRDNVLSFYKKAFEMSNIEVVGIGTNLGCMYGVEPTYDKLIQLSLYKQLLEAKFDRRLDYISGGSSITLPLVSRHKIPKTVNHFRNGEAIFLGTSPFDNKKFDGLSEDAFEYSANIIELEEKAYVPEGKISEGNVGHTSEEEEYEPHEKSCKAILDFGILDVDTDEIAPKDPGVKFIGTTSDLTVYDLGTNKRRDGKTKYKVGNRISFKPSYMGTARLMHSKFVEKKLI